MKKKVDEINELEKYLKKPSKKLLEKIDSVELTDFPKLSVEFIRKKNYLRLVPDQSSFILLGRTF